MIKYYLVKLFFLTLCTGIQWYNCDGYKSVCVAIFLFFYTPIMSNQWVGQSVELFRRKSGIRAVWDWREGRYLD